MCTTSSATAVRDYRTEALLCACAGIVVLLLSNRSLPLGGLGRRGIMVTGGIAFLIGALLQALAQNIGMLIAGRIFLGVGIGFANEVGPFARGMNLQQLLTVPALCIQRMFVPDFIMCRGIGGSAAGILQPSVHVFNCSCGCLSILKSLQRCHKCFC